MDFLMLTTLDVLGRTNNREHHVIAAARDRYDRVHVVYRRRGAPDRGLGAMLQSATTTDLRAGVTYVGVDPLLNPPDGVVRAQTQSRRPWCLRRMLGQGMDSVAVLRDMATIRALHQAALPFCTEPAPVCVALGPWAARAAETLRDQGRIRAYTYVDRDYEPGFMSAPLRRRWAVAQERRAAGRADLTLSIGQRLAARFADVAGANVAISPTGVDCSAIPSRLRHSPAPALLFVGEVAPWSGIEEAIAALTLLPADWTLRVIGPVQDGYRAHLVQVAAEAGVADRLTLLGRCARAAVFDELDAAGIGLAVFRPHPLRIYAAPLKLLEYMAAGLPALALQGSEAGDILTATGAGATCDCTATDIASAVLAMTRDPAAYTAQSQAGPAAAALRDWALVMAAEFNLIGQLYARPRAAQ